MKFTGISCPKCGKKALQHPSLWGGSRHWLDYDRAICRKCGSGFKIINRKITGAK